MCSWYWFSAATIFTLGTIIYVESSPLCVEADVSKRFCGPVMEEALRLNCDLFPSLESKERAMDDGLGISDMCCHRECTLRILLDNFCEHSEVLRRCLRTNKINQDRDNVQTAAIDQIGKKNIQDLRKQPEIVAESAAMARKAAEVGLNVKFFRGPKCHCKRITHNRNHHRFSQVNRKRGRQGRSRPSLRSRLRYRVHHRAQHTKRHIDSTTSNKCYKNHNKYRRRRNKQRKCRCPRRTLTSEARSNNAIIREAIVGEEEGNGSQSIFQDIPIYFPRTGADIRKHSNDE